MTTSGANASPNANARRADDLTLYYFETCPFCVRVLRAMELLGVEMNLRNVREEPAHRKELVEGGGKSTVPCLRIDSPDGETTWMYESADIIKYLTDRFG
ncbi:glutathione S-transferase N-terminal domain-containing protein [Ectothiorhodospiraceae bacterium WFHF3C12]|nr:glutathione S-transferase N-terminal domain-containing protein [Ectothiorhodospiraceae bacterium WFHF3C12]